MASKKSDWDEGFGRSIKTKEAAEMLGVSVSTVQRMFRSGELPSFMVRNVRRTSTTAVRDYIRKQQARQEVLCKVRKR